MITAVLMICLELGVCVEPPNPKQQQYVFDQLQQQMWGGKTRNTCRNALFSSCDPWVTDA